MGPGTAVAPSWALPLGADALGRDVLARVAHGAVATAVSALVVTVVCAVIALVLGPPWLLGTGGLAVGGAMAVHLAGDWLGHP